MLCPDIKIFRVSEELVISEFELSGVNYYRNHCQIQGELDLVRVNEEFKLSEFDLLGRTTVFLSPVRLLPRN